MPTRVSRRSFRFSKTVDIVRPLIQSDYEVNGPTEFVLLTTLAHIEDLQGTETEHASHMQGTVNYLVAIRKPMVSIEVSDSILVNDKRLNITSIRTQNGERDLVLTCRTDDTYSTADTMR